MNQTKPIFVSGTGSYTPEGILTNADLTRMVDTTEEWIETRTGIRERRIAESGELTSDMAIKASQEAMKAAGLQPHDIDLVLVATITPDMPFPSTACIIQNRLGLRPVPAMDIEAACSGFLYVLEVGSAMLQSGNMRHALVVGSEKLSSIIDWEDRATCVLFGDGAGAVILSRGESPSDNRVLSTNLGSDGRGAEILYMPGGGALCPPSPASLADRQHFLKMNGKEVFKIAVRVMEKAAKEILMAHNLQASDVALVIPHQANVRIIEVLSSRLGLPMERFAVNIDRYGNTSAASIPIALDEAVKSGQIKKGDLILMVAFGAGLTWAASLMRWH